MQDVVPKEPEWRFALLREVYRVAVGNTHVGLGPSSLRDCMRRVMLSASNGEPALNWLVDEGLLTRTGTRATIYISHAGVKEVEVSFADTDDGTTHFPASVIRSSAPHRS